jgi:general secretion pathway protein G
MKQRQTDFLNRWMWQRRVMQAGQRGVTLLEINVVITIMLILMGAAAPLVKVSVRRQREVELRRDLWEMRSAIDRYKDAADKNSFQIKLGSEGYPPDIDTLVKGVEVTGGKKLRFLRRIPVDPMTGNTDSDSASKYPRACQQVECAF